MGSKAIYPSKIDRSAKWIHPSLLTNHNHHHSASRTYFHRLYRLRVGRNRSVGIATRYWLDGRGIESRWGRDFPHLSRPVLGPTQPPIQWVTKLLSRVKALTPPSHLASIIRKSRAMPLLSLWALTGHLQAHQNTRLRPGRMWFVLLKRMTKTLATVPRLAHPPVLCIQWYI